MRGVLAGSVLLVAAAAQATDRSPSVAIGAGGVMAVDPARAGPSVSGRLSWPVGRVVDLDIDLNGWTLEGTERVAASTEWAGGFGPALVRGGDVPGLFWRLSAGPALLAVQRPTEELRLGFGASVTPVVGWQSRRPTFRYEAAVRGLVTNEGSRVGLFVGASYALR
jgi:hypothetical protein